MTLYLVSTPIGHLGDLSQRSKEILSTVPLILAEDTRSFAKLQTRLDQRIPGQKVLSYHCFNESQRSEQILRHLQTQDAALISDAGTPCICDPGQQLVASCHQVGIPVRSVGTLCAFAASFSCSGFSAPLLFHGFPSKKPSELEAVLTSCFQGDHRFMTHSFYVSKHQIKNVIAEAARLAKARDHFDARLHLSKEISKIHETHLQGRLLDTNWIDSSFLEKGEWVLLLRPSLDPKQNTAILPEQACELARRLRDEGLPLKKCSKISAATFSVSANCLYQHLLEQQ